MRHILAVTSVVLLSAAVAWAQDWDLGNEAYERGDYAAALMEWRPLAEAGDASAQNNLGLMYNKGEGVTQDSETAYMRFDIGCALGDKLGCYNRDKLSVMMTPADISEAQRHARICMESAYKDCE
jgi:TPR repeat protein